MLIHFIRILFLFQNGMVLLSQMFDTGPVVGIKCRTTPIYSPQETRDLGEELVVLYSQSIITLDGFALAQTLRACRSQVAKGKNLKMLTSYSKLIYFFVNILR